MSGPRSQPPTLDGFKALDWLGGGGFADVFRYEETALGRPVAVKVLHGGLGSAALDSFRHEASVMAKLSSHTSIVSIYRTGVSKDRRPYLVMELCPPPHLGVRIGRTPYAVPNALELTIQIAGAVETAHRLGVLHRDIKPANILFSQYRRPLLTDFGISVATGGTGGIATALSPLWAPPEQFGNTTDPVGPHSDVYSLGATLWAMLVGRSPMDVPGGANDRLAVAERVRRQPAPRTNRADVPESLERVLSAGMAKRPEERYGTVLEFARALQAVQAEQHLAVTDVELLDDQLDEAARVSDGTGTVIGGFLLINPDLPTSGSGTQTGHFSDLGSTAAPASSGPAPYVLRHGTGSAPAIQPLDFTALPVPEVPAAPGAAAPEQPATDASPSPGRSRTVLAVLASLVVVVVLVAAVAVLLGQLGPGTSSAQPSTPAVAPRDPVGVAVPRVTSLKLVPSGSKVRVSWRNPKPEPGDSYLYEVKDPSRPKETPVVTSTSVTVASQPGRTCVGVVLRRANGTVSEQEVKCDE